MYLDRPTGERATIALEGVFLQIGLVPNTEWIGGAVSLSRHGEIEVDAKSATSEPGVFAAGDVPTVPFKQIAIAVEKGTEASLGAFERLMLSSVEDNAPAQAAQPALITA
ncbi:alkyl hydroperoxide reductase [Pandoraea terrigena]|uniref:Alkyl hydroperoxide reductase n=1 Tax=Pandoraea terrigena TaxID=2508292 RepID=A0A5E4STS5_9BURK|nr:alkyl hydroperoxide reductase [Pandoraea terrigena]